MTHNTEPKSDDDDLLAFAQNEIGTNGEADPASEEVTQTFDFSTQSEPMSEVAVETVASDLVDLEDQSDDTPDASAQAPTTDDDDTGFSLAPEADPVESTNNDETTFYTALASDEEEESVPDAEPAEPAEPDPEVTAEAIRALPRTEVFDVSSIDPAELAELGHEPPDIIEATPEPELEEDPLPDGPVARRRADVDAKQAIIARHLESMGCEAAILFTPAHVAWFTGGMNVRGLIAETERPGVFTNGRQRWLVCSNVDSQRFFDEELDQLGFQLKEWQWSSGRAPLIGELMAGKRIASDRPFPNMPLIGDRIRADLRPLLPSDLDRFLALGQLVAHAVEATARTLTRRDTEQEVAGQVAHRLLHHGADLVGVSVAADDRARRFRRSGFTLTPIERVCTIQATGTRDGLHVTVSRTVCFGKPDQKLREEFTAASKLSAAYRALGTAGKTVSEAVEGGRRVLKESPFEFEWRLSQPGYGTGWHAAEELRRMGMDEPFATGQAVVWQARVGSAAVVDTVLAGPDAVTPATPPDGWPFKRITIGERSHDIPDLLVRTF